MYPTQTVTFMMTSYKNIRDQPSACSVLSLTAPALCALAYLCYDLIFRKNFLLFNSGWTEWRDPDSKRPADHTSMLYIDITELSEGGYTLFYNKKRQEL